MGHYDIGEWTDFVRGLLPETRRNEMDRHLASGCGECHAIFGFVGQVAQVAHTEPAYEGPALKLSGAARSVFRGEARRPVSERLVAAFETLVATLTFDSARELHPAGARGSRSSNRQMMYQAGDYCIDLRMDQERDSMKVILVGQVANQKDPLLKLARLPVSLMAGKKMVSETASNEFGEFSLEFLPRPNLRLCVQVTPAGFQLGVPLKRLLEEHET
jgi:hypothetical protein